MEKEDTKSGKANLIESANQHSSQKFTSRCVSLQSPGFGTALPELVDKHARSDRTCAIISRSSMPGEFSTITLTVHSLMDNLALFNKGMSVRDCQKKGQVTTYP